MARPRGKPGVSEIAEVGQRRGAARRTLLPRALSARETGVFLALMVLCIFLSLASDSFLSTINLLNIGRQISLLGIMAVGMTFVLIAGEVDLSVGSTYAFAGLAIQSGKPFTVGHWITVGDHEGRVAEVTWRATKLRTKAGNFVIVPNSEVGKAPITNYSEPAAPTRLSIEVGVEVKVLAKAMIKQIDRVISDLGKQVEHFTQKSGQPICVAVVGINFSETYTSYEGLRTWPTDARGTNIQFRRQPRRSLGCCRALQRGSMSF